MLFFVLSLCVISVIYRNSFLVHLEAHAHESHTLTLQQNQQSSVNVKNLCRVLNKARISCADRKQLTGSFLLVENFSKTKVAHFETSTLKKRKDKQHQFHTACKKQYRYTTKQTGEHNKKTKEQKKKRQEIQRRTCL